MRTDHLPCDAVQAADGGNDPLAEEGVLPHFVQLVSGQAAALAEDRVGDADHADVVEPKAVFETRVGGQVRRDALGEPQREPRDPDPVRLGLGEETAAVVM
jgi:hypothetical protein